MQVLSQCITTTSHRQTAVLGGLNIDVRFLFRDHVYFVHFSLVKMPSCAFRSSYRLDSFSATLPDTLLYQHGCHWNDAQRFRFPSLLDTYMFLFRSQSIPGNLQHDRNVVRL